MTKTLPTPYHNASRRVNIPLAVQGEEEMEKLGPIKNDKTNPFLCNVLPHTLVQ